MSDFQLNADDPTRTISITLVSGVEAAVDEARCGESSLLTWMPNSFSSRDLDPPATFIECMALEVINISPSHLARRDGLQITGSRVRAVRTFEFRHVGEDDRVREKILSLPRLTKEALFGSIYPTDSSPTSFGDGHLAKIKEARTAVLLKCGGLRLKAPIQMIVQGSDPVDLQGRYAPKPDLSSATTVPGEISGIVIGHDKLSAVIHMLDVNERKLVVKFGKKPLEGKVFGELEDERTSITVQVEVGYDKKGQAEYHYVSHRL